MLSMEPIDLMGFGGPASSCPPLFQAERLEMPE